MAVLGIMSLGRAALGALEWGITLEIDILDYIGVHDIHSKSPIKLIHDSASLADNYSRLWESYRILPEMLGLYDSRFSYVGSYISDSMSLVDYRYHGMYSVYTDALGLYDSRYSSVLRCISDTIGLLDNYSRLWSIARVYSDIVELFDLSCEKDTQLYLHDLTELYDVICSSSSKVLLDYISPYDEYTRVWSLYREYQEMVGLIDYQLKDVFSCIAELLHMYDSIALDRGKMLFDYLGIADSLCKGSSNYLYDSIGLVDVYNRTWTAFLFRFDNIGLLDRISKSTGKRILNKIALYDLCFRNISAVITDMLELCDIIDYRLEIILFRTQNRIKKLIQLVDIGGL